jgi:hypothetical protein
MYIGSETTEKAHISAVDKILDKSRKTIDERDSVIVEIFGHLTTQNHKYLSKKQAIKDIIGAMVGILAPKTSKSSHGMSKSDLVSKTIEHSESIQKVCEDVCCMILQNQVQTGEKGSHEFNYLKPDLYHTLEDLGSKLSQMDSEIDQVSQEIAQTKDENTL